MSSSLRNFYYGLTLAVFPLGLFFSSPILGDFSDGLGRKKILVFAVYAVGLCYVVSGLAIMEKSLALLIFSRFLAGCVSGSQPIAQAAIMDMSTPSAKAKNLGLIFFFTSLGFTVGPLLGSWLSDVKIMPWFDLSTPMYVAALASIACGLVLQWQFKETLTENRVVSFRPFNGIALIYEALQQPEVRPFLCILFLLQLGWSCFFQIIPMYLTQCFHCTAAQVGHYIAVIAIGFALAFCGVIAYLSKQFGEVRVLKVASVSVCFLFALSFSVRSEYVLWLIGAPIGFCVAHIYVLSTTLASNCVPASHQGWLMGAVMGLVAAAWCAAPIVGSILINWHSTAPLIFAFVLSTLSAVIVLRVQK